MAGGRARPCRDRLRRPLARRRFGGDVERLPRRRASDRSRRVSTRPQTGDTVQVCAGNFPEQVVIAKSLKLVGAGSAQTTIVLPPTSTGTQRRRHRRGRSGVNVEISGFTIRARPKRLRRPALRCLRPWWRKRQHPRQRDHRQARRARSTAARRGSRIRVGRLVLSTCGTATITNNMISDYQKTGIAVDGTGSAATITNNTITGAGPTTVIAQNGMQISRGADRHRHRQHGLRERLHRTRTRPRPGSCSSARSATSPSRTTRFGTTTTGIILASVEPTGGSDVIVRANTITGGDYGIAVSGTTRTLIEANTTTGAANNGIDANEDSSENTFRENEASGATGAEQLRLQRHLARQQEQRHREHLDGQHRRPRHA